MIVITTTLFCYAACQTNYSNGISWSRYRIGLQATIRCSVFHPSFRSGVHITRTCDVNGEWGNANFSDCSMRQDAFPFIMVEGKGLAETNTSLFESQVYACVCTYM